MFSEFGVAAGGGFNRIEAALFGPATFGTGAEPFAMVSMAAVAFLFLYFVFR